MFLHAAQAADELGFESLWLPEHLVFPVSMSSSPFAGEDHPPVPPSTPVFDALAYLSYLAGRTRKVKLATHVYNLALRHPFVSARAVQTADVVSDGRLLLGVGAGWLRSEWEACGLDFSSRGRRLDEALQVCLRLWGEEVVEHHGEFFDFGPVMFEPKPVQIPHPPVLIGGESEAAIARAARHDGWVGLDHEPESARRRAYDLQARRSESGAEAPFSITVGAMPTGEADIASYEAAGVDRIIVAPWERTREVPRSLEAFARRYIA